MIQEKKEIEQKRLEIRGWIEEDEDKLCNNLA